MCTPHDPAQICNMCNVRMSGKRLLTDCQEFTQQRVLFLRGNRPNVNEVLSAKDKIFKF